MIITPTKKAAFKYLHGFKVSVIGLLVIIGIGVFFNSITPIIYGNIIDAMTAKDFEGFTRHLIVYAVLMVSTAILSCMEGYVTKTVASKIYRKHQQGIFLRMLRTRLPSLEKLELGQLTSYLAGDLQVIIQYDIELFTSVVFILLNFFLPLVFIFIINVKMALIAVLFIPISIVIYFKSKKKKQTIQKAIQDNEDVYSSYTISCIQNTSTVKAYRIEQPVSHKYNILTEGLRLLEKQRDKLDSLISLFNHGSSSLFQVVFLLITCILIINGEITLGIFVSFGIYASKLFSSVDLMLKVQLSEQTVKVSLDRLQNLLGSKLEDYGDTSVAKNKEDIKKLDVRGISFSYENTDKVLSGLTLSIESNGFYSIVGENGSGKSTLFKILMKFYDVSDGSIFINEINYIDCNVSMIREHITYVQKEPFVLSDTILENIRLYNYDITKEAAEQICHTVGLQAFINSLPKGICTKISEGTLSSGQLQKLSFARALAHPADIMLFDEITSDLDGASERNMVDIMKKLGETKIVLSISHRINAVSTSDKIFVLKNGAIINEGIFDYLQHSCDPFYAMFPSISSVS